MQTKTTNASTVCEVMQARALLTACNGAMHGMAAALVALAYSVDLAVTMLPGPTEDGLSDADRRIISADVATDKGEAVEDLVKATAAISQLAQQLIDMEPVATPGE